MKATQFLKILLFPLLTLFVLTCNAQTPYALKEGVDYQLIQAQSSSPKIEIIEFFSYACPHCYELDPLLKEWEKKLPKDVEFHRIPAPGNPTWAALAYTFYTLEALGVLNNLHTPIFDAIHVDKIDLTNEVQLKAWLTKQQVDYKKFTDARNSFAVQTKVNKAKQWMIAYSLSSVPTIVVDGRYVTGIMTTAQAVPDTLNKLILMARQARQKK